jgi:DNA-binding NtrC family response regulator
MVKLAHRGTLYLEQIDQMPPEAQSSLLEFLRSKERKRGARIVVYGLEARVVASTTIDLEGLVVSGRFNRALFERLVAVEIDIPPLRERVTDIPLLAQQFQLKCSRCLGYPVSSISSLPVAELQAYRWPGNVQELKIAVKRAVTESQGGVIEPHHFGLPEEEASPRGPECAPPKLQHVMEQYVFTVLNGCGGNKVKAAEVLGISRSTLYRMLDSAQEKVENPEFDLSAA